MISSVVLGGGHDEVAVWGLIFPIHAGFCPAAHVMVAEIEFSCACFLRYGSCMLTPQQMSIRLTQAHMQTLHEARGEENPLPFCPAAYGYKSVSALETLLHAKCGISPRLPPD